jgi:hypothetical protein
MHRIIKEINDFQTGRVRTKQPRNADIWAYRFHLLPETHQMEEVAVRHVEMFQSIHRKNQSMGCTVDRILKYFNKS